ncbi:MAG: ferrous iron transport protein B [Clostridia bacterium]|nr:ferrous iron transport protein B [Clostridia bacterium]
MRLKKIIQKKKHKEFEEYRIGIAGNPNVGKSTVFNSLTGMHQHTGNWTGKTVSNAVGKCKYKDKEFVFTDIPGTYSLMTNSEEEEIARDYICSNDSDVIVVVVDATSLERNLNLVYQIFEITSNVIVCVNLLDEAKKKGITINLKQLSKELGVPVVGTVARKKKTLVDLLQTIYETSKRKLTMDPNRIQYAQTTRDIADEGTDTIDFKDEIVFDIIIKSQEICQKVCKYKKGNYKKKDERIDKILTSKFLGIPIMIAFLGVIFWITIVGANYPSQMLSNLFGFIQGKLYILFEAMNAPVWITKILIDGMYLTLSWVVSVMLPPMLIFFPLFTFLEDLGYLPRIAFNLDNCFRKSCTSGKQALTMCMGFGCNAVGVIGCRIINQTREKIVAMLTNVFVPCNGRFPLLIVVSSILVSILGITSGASFISTLFVLLVILFGIYLSLIISKILSITLLKGEKSTFTLELPPFRKPQIGKILVRSIFDRSLFVLGRAVVVAAPAGIIIWLLANIGIADVTLLQYIVNFLDPLARLMGMDGHILTAFILGIPANEIVLPIMLMSYLKSGVMVDLENSKTIFDIFIQNGWTAITAINVMIFTLLHFPCATTLLTINKEGRSFKWTLISFIVPTMCGIIVCMATNLIYQLIM